MGGFAFNHSCPHRAMAKIVDNSEEKNNSESELATPPKLKMLTANEAMKHIDDLT